MRKALIGGALIATGIGVSVAAFVLMTVQMLLLTFDSDHTTRMLVPYSGQVIITASGQYALCNDFDSEFGGKEYHMSQELTGDWSYSLKTPDGRELETVDCPSYIYCNSQGWGVEVCAFDVPAKGVYTLEVKGDGTSRPFSLRPELTGPFLRYLTLVRAVMAVSLVLGIVGVVFLGLGIVEWVWKRRFASAYGAGRNPPANRGQFPR